MAFIGRSTVGKSSLLNALVGRKAIARISKTPGKTRDCNVYRIDERLYLVDLPGYGYARVSKTERRRLRELIERYLQYRRELAGVVWLLDVRRTPSQLDMDVADMLAEGEIPILLAITKGDKLARQRRTDQMRSILDVVQLSQEQTIVTSAVTKEGMDDLKESILALAAEAGSDS